MLDLHLTATTDSKGQLIPIEAEEMSDEDLPTLPPLVTYCSYVRFGCAFGKWVFVVLIVNVMALQVNIKAGYFAYSRLWPLLSWHGYLLATVWFMTALWFYRCAKVVEKDLQMMDQHNYQPVRLSDDDISSPSVAIHEQIYGHASRKLDTIFHSRNASSSSLISLSLVLCALSLSAAVHLVTGLAWGSQYQTTCDFRIHRNATSSNKTILSDIEAYPEDVQTWIVQQSDPWANQYQMQQFDNDDEKENGDDGIQHRKAASGRDAAFSFPTAHAIDNGIIAPMSDGTVLLAGQPVGEIAGKRTYMVLVEIPGTGGPPKYHMDFRNPGLFIPVAKTASKNENGNWVASEYCFTASNEDQMERQKSRRSWTSIIQSTTLYCVTAKEESKNGGLDISKTNIVWTDKVHHGANMNAASTGNEILVSRAGTDDFSTVCQEVISVNPATMKSKTVYNRLSSQGGNHYYYSEFHIVSETTRCIQNHVQGGSAVASMVVMVLSGYWLIVREGVPAGVAPILLSVVSLIRFFSGEWGSGVARMSLTVGMLFFHGVLACGNVCHLPTWIGRGMYVWALYSWSISFIMIDWIFQMGGVGYMATVCLCLSGIVLNHPIPQVIGYSYVLMGTWSFILFPFFGYDADTDGRPQGHLAYGTLHILAGIGIIGLSRCLSNNRRYLVAFCRPISRAWRIIFYGGPSKKPRTSAV